MEEMMRTDWLKLDSNMLMDASEAKAYVEAGKAQKDIDNLAEVTTKINQAIQKGELMTWVPFVTHNTKKQLESKGYKVTVNNNQMDGTDYTIEWK